MKAVSAWTTTDGVVFTDNKLAQAHELNLLRRSALKPLLAGMTDQLHHESGGDTRIDDETLEKVILDNADALRAALSVKPATNRGRKSKDETV